MGHLRPVLGASLFSAGGALPSHLMPILLMAWITNGQASLESAGILAAAHSLGILCALLATPSTGVLFPRARWLYLAALVLLVMLVASYWLTDHALRLVWWVTGLCAGLMQYVGSVICSQATEPRAAFALRLAVSLLFAGVAALVVSDADGLGERLPLIWVVVGLELAILLLALWMLSGVAAQKRLRQPVTREGFAVPRGGLLVLFLLFVGQVGFYVFALKAMTASAGLSHSEVTLALAMAKLTVSGLLYALVRHGHDLVARFGFVVMGCVLIVALLLLSQVRQVAFVFVGFVLWELSFNAIVAAFQGELAKRHPTFVGMWASVPIFLGAAAGPFLHGHLLAQGWETAFLGFALMSALGPALWARGAMNRLTTHRGQPDV